MQFFIFLTFYFSLSFSDANIPYSKVKKNSSSTAKKLFEVGVKGWMDSIIGCTGGNTTTLGVCQFKFFKSLLEREKVVHMQ